MIKKLKAIIAVATLSSTMGANVHAEEITVQKGDTLLGISQGHDTSVEEIKNRNHLTTDLIHPGDVIQIATKKHYIVQQDDTLLDVAEKYQVTINQIKEWNKLNTDEIHPGLKLVIYDDLTNNIKSVEATPSKVDTVDQREAVAAETVSRPDVKNSDSEKSVNDQSKKVDQPVNSKINHSKIIMVKATAYTASCEGCSGKTKTGVDLNKNPDAKVIAVDPSVIPLGSKVYVEGYGEATAADTGSAIKGKRIDVFIPSKDKANKWGKKEVKVTILSE